MLCCLISVCWALPHPAAPGAVSVNLEVPIFPAVLSGGKGARCSQSLLAVRCSGSPQWALLCTNWRPCLKLLATQHLLGQRDTKGHQLCGVLLSQAWAKVPGARWTLRSERKTQEGCCGRGVAGPDPAPSSSSSLHVHTPDKHPPYLLKSTSH